VVPTGSRGLSLRTLARGEAVGTRGCQSWRRHSHLRKKVFTPNYIDATNSTTYLKVGHQIVPNNH